MFEHGTMVQLLMAGRDDRGRALNQALRDGATNCYREILQLIVAQRWWNDLLHSDGATNCCTEMVAVQRIVAQWWCNELLHRWCNELSSYVCDRVTYLRWYCYETFSKHLSHLTFSLFVSRFFDFIQQGSPSDSTRMQIYNILWFT